MTATSLSVPEAERWVPTSRTNETVGEALAPLFDLRLLCTGAIRAYVALATGPVDEAGLTLPQWGVLERCARGQANTVTELTEIVPVDQASISRAADKLVRVGLLRRRRQSRDRRVVRLEATDKGRAIVRQLSPSIAAVYTTLLEGIQADELHVFTRVAQRISANARGHQPWKGGGDNGAASQQGPPRPRVGPHRDGQSLGEKTTAATP